MQIIEVLTIIFIISIISFVIGRYIYKRIKKQPVGECACCAQRMKKTLKRGFKEIKKEL